MSESTVPGEHIEVDRLLALACGEVTGDEAAAIESHARGCRDCGDELAVMLALRLDEAEHAGLPRAATRPAEISALRSRRIGIALIAASGVFVALLGGWATWQWMQPSLDASRLATAEPPEPLDLDFLLGAQRPVATGDATRSGFELIGARRFGEAAEVLSSTYASRPDELVAMGWGIALYLDGDDSERVGALLVQASGAQDQVIKDFSLWYLGNHYLRRGDLDQALRVLEDVSRQPDFPGTRARDLLRRLRS